MGFTGVGISKTNSFGGAISTPDSVGILVIGGAVAASGLALKTAKALLSPKDAESVGIDPSYDDTNNILAYHHIDEFFRIAPDGKLYIVLDDGSLTDATLKTILKQNQDISFGGVVRNSATAPADFGVFIGKYQNIINDLSAEGRLISSFLVEGKEFDPATAIADYPDLRSNAMPNISVVIAQDPVIRALKSQYETYGAIGTALGSIAVRKVNENIGSVNIEVKPKAYRGTLDYPLTDKGRQRWMGALLQSGKNVEELNANEIKALNDKGYLFVGSYNGYAGYYWNNSHTAVTKTSDYAHIENNRVWNKAALIIRKALLPKVKSNIDKDPATGYINETTAKELEAFAEKKLGQMVADKEASGVGVYIDPKQALRDDVPLVVKVQVVHNDIIHKFNVQLGLTDKIS